MEKTVGNKVPSENILVGTLFPTVISRGTLGNHILLRISCQKKQASSKNTCNKIWFP
jgi:hypothetical protein